MTFIFFQPAVGGGPEYTVAKGTRRRRRREVEEDKETNLEEPIEIRAEGPRTGEAREKKHSVLLVGFDVVFVVPCL